MGRNAQRRKEARNAGRTPSAVGLPAPTSVRVDASDMLGALSAPLGLSQLARRSCDECGGSDIAWSTVAGLRAAVREDQRPRVDEIAAFAGPRADAWRCRSCGNFGVFGGIEASDGW